MQVYFVRGFGKGKVEKPFPVYCWMADRQGGGWTLGMVNWYYNSNPFRNFGTGSWNQGLVGNRRILNRKQEAYKLSDRQIQAVIGQEPGQASKFSVMGDQAGHHGYYSSGNYEYSILKDYNQVWRFQWNRRIGTSKTESWMYSYEIKSFDGYNPVGDGKENWKGVLKCGDEVGSGTSAGITCRGVKKGKPSPPHTHTHTPPSLLSRFSFKVIKRTAAQILNQPCLRVRKTLADPTHRDRSSGRPGVQKKPGPQPLGWHSPLVHDGQQHRHGTVCHAGWGPSHST